MHSCQEVFELLSQQPPGTLPHLTRMKLRLHLILCKMCRRYRQQIRVLDSLLCEPADQQQTGLGETAKKRIAAALKNARIEAGSESNPGESQ